MSDWVNWQDFAKANEPEVTRSNEANEDAQRQAQAQMDAQLRDLSTRAMSRADFGQRGDLTRLGGYSELMKQQQEALAPRGEIGAPWEESLGRKQFDSPWAQLNSRLGGIAQKAAQRGQEVRNAQEAAKQKKEMADWDAEQKRLADEAQNGNRNRDAEAYAKWSDAVQAQGARSGGSGAGAWYDWASGKGVAPVMSPSSPRTKDVQRIYRQNPSYVSSSNFGNTNNAGGTIFTGNWSF